MSSWMVISRRARCVGFGWMATVATAIPRGSAPPERSTFSSKTDDSYSQAFHAAQSLSLALKEPKPVRALSSPTGPSVPHHAKKRQLSELASELSHGYPSLPPLQLPLSDSCQRAKNLLFLALDCSPDDTDVLKVIDVFAKNAEGTSTVSSRYHSAALTKLRQVATPHHEDILECVLKHDPVQGMEFLVSLRADLIRVTRWMKATSSDDERLPRLKDMDVYLQRLFSIWFSRGMLDLQRITFENTSASIIEYIATKEAVHPMKSLDDLRSRLGPGRRVFALFHPLLPSKPVVFVHVALKSTVPSQMSDVLEIPHSEEDMSPKVATFYSISNSQPGLAGVGLGEHLLKQAISALQTEFPSLETFVTLSPMPKFRHWLADKIRNNEENGHFYDASILSEQDRRLLVENNLLADGASWSELYDLLRDFPFENEEEEASVQSKIVNDVLLKMASRYLVLEKHRGKPLDGVARFHLGNGAELHRLNVAADLSRKGKHNSFGMMVNYRYPMDKVKENQEAFETDYRIQANTQVLKWLPVDATATTSKL